VLLIVDLKGLGGASQEKSAARICLYRTQRGSAGSLRQFGQRQSLFSAQWPQGSRAIALGSVILHLVSAAEESCRIVFRRQFIQIKAEHRIGISKGFPGTLLGAAGTKQQRAKESANRQTTDQR
jgi:hypothetical protein